MEVTRRKWEFYEELFSTIKTSIEKGNKSQTTLAKGRRVFNKYECLIMHYSGYETIDKDALKRFKIKEKALKCLKSGFINLSNFMVNVKLSNIDSYRMVGGEESRCKVTCDGKETECDEEIYYILQEIFK